MLQLVHGSMCICSGTRSSSCITWLGFILHHSPATIIVEGDNMNEKICHFIDACEELMFQIPGSSISSVQRETYTSAHILTQPAKKSDSNSLWTTSLSPLAYVLHYDVKYCMTGCNVYKTAIQSAIYDWS